MNIQIPSSPVPSAGAVRSWAWIAWVSAGVSVVFMVMGCFVLLSSFSLLFTLLGAGGVAGALASRHGWLAGVVSTIPFAFQQVTRHAMIEYGSLLSTWGHVDYWLIAIPAAVLASSVGILGGITGAWLFGAWFKPRP